MKKVTSVNEIKNHMEEECKSAWALLMNDTQLFGNDSHITKRSRTKWATLNTLYEDMFYDYIQY